MAKHVPASHVRVVIKDGGTFVVPYVLRTPGFGTGLYSRPSLPQIVARVKEETGKENLLGIWLDDDTCLITEHGKPVAIGRTVKF